VVEILRKGYSRIPVFEPSATGAFMYVSVSFGIAYADA
jgi:hypothetical protein